MKIAVDLDGTAWKYREFYKELLIAMKSRGHTIGVITGHNHGLYVEDIRLWKARGFPEFDFWIDAEDGHLTGDAKEWKATRAKAAGVDIHFDDFNLFQDITMLSFMRDESCE